MHVQRQSLDDSSDATTYSPIHSALATPRARIALGKRGLIIMLHKTFATILSKATRFPSTMSGSAITPKRQCVVALPCLSPACSCLVEFVSLAQATRFLASRGKATSFAVLVNRFDDPVDSWVSADGCVLRVNENDFEVFVGRVLVDPVRVKDSKISASAAYTLFGGGFEGSLIFELVDTLVGGFAVCCTLGDRLLATTSSNTNAVDHIALLSFVAQAASFVRSGGSSSTVDDSELTQLPASDSEKES